MTNIWFHMLYNKMAFRCPSAAHTGDLWATFSNQA